MGSSSAHKGESGADVACREQSEASFHRVVVVNRSFLRLFYEKYFWLLLAQVTSASRSLSSFCLRLGDTRALVAVAAASRLIEIL